MQVDINSQNTRRTSLNIKLYRDSLPCKDKLNNPIIGRLPHRQLTSCVRENVRVSNKEEQYSRRDWTIKSAKHVPAF